MSTIIQSISEIQNNYQAFFCDVWGVVHNGETANVAAVEALMRLRAAGKFVALVTNAPKTPSAIIEQLREKNIPDTAYDAIITAGEALQHAMFTTDLKAPYFIGRDSDRVLFSDLPDGISNDLVDTSIDQADSVLCAGLRDDDIETVADYEIELRQALNRKLPMYCANPDITVHRGEKLIYCAGALAQFYENLGGTVYNFGKPFPPIYQLAMNKAQPHFGNRLGASDVLFIGDGVLTDLKGAMLEDMDALFVSGGLAFEETGTDRESDKPTPDMTMLQEFLSENQSNPLYTIGTLR